MGGIIRVEKVKSINILPRHEEAVIPIRKFTEYALNYEADSNKATAFESALGYTKDNADSLIANIRQKLPNFTATPKGDRGYGETYEVIMELTGVNGKTAKVLTAWIDDRNTGQMRLVSAYVDN